MRSQVQDTRCRPYYLSKAELRTQRVSRVDLPLRGFRWRVTGYPAALDPNIDMKRRRWYSTPHETGYAKNQARVLLGVLLLLGFLRLVFALPPYRFRSILSFGVCALVFATDL